MIVEIRDEVISLSGSLRRNEWRTLEAALRLSLAKHPKGIVLDCDGLKAVTPDGAETFRAISDHLSTPGEDTRYVVACLPDHAAATLRRVPNVFSQLPLAATVTDARMTLGLTDVANTTAAEPRPDGETATTINGTQNYNRPVLVALLGTDADAHAVVVGCRLARSGDAPVHLAQMLQVPRNRPLLSALGAEEEDARADLLRFDAAVRQMRLTPVLRVERTRATGERLARVALEINARALTIALLHDADTALVEIAETASAKTACAVIINRLRPAVSDDDARKAANP